MAPQRDRARRCPSRVHSPELLHCILSRLFWNIFLEHLVASDISHYVHLHWVLNSALHPPHPRRHCIRLFLSREEQLLHPFELSSFLFLCCVHSERRPSTLPPCHNPSHNRCLLHSFWLWNVPIISIGMLVRVGGERRHCRRRSLTHIGEWTHSFLIIKGSEMLWRGRWLWLC